MSFFYLSDFDKAMQRLGYNTAMNDPDHWEKIMELYTEKVKLETETAMRFKKIKGSIIQGKHLEITNWLNQFQAKAEVVLIQGLARANLFMLLSPLLFLSSFFLLLLTFEPFRLGWKPFAACIGIIVGTTISMERTLSWLSEKRLVLFTISLIALVFFLYAHFELGVIRGEIFKIMLVTEANPGNPDRIGDFYPRSSERFKWVFPLMSMGMEILLGYCFFSVEFIKEKVNSSSIIVGIEAHHRYQTPFAVYKP